jgi:hypothetical protein
MGRRRNGVSEHIDTKMDAKAWAYPYACYVRYQAEHGAAPG